MLGQTIVYLGQRLIWLSLCYFFMLMVSKGNLLCQDIQVQNMITIALDF